MRPVPIFSVITLTLNLHFSPPVYIAFKDKIKLKWSGEYWSRQTSLIYLRLNINKYLVVMEMKKAAHKRRPLNDKSANEEVEANGGKAIALQKGHQEAETDEHHNVHILEHCNKNTN